MLYHAVSFFAGSTDSTSLDQLQSVGILEQVYTSPVHVELSTARQRILWSTSPVLLKLLSLLLEYLSLEDVSFVACVFKSSKPLA